MSRLRLPAFVLSLLAVSAPPGAQSPTARPIDIADPGWTRDGDVRIARVLDRQALACGSGAAYFPELRFRDGTLEFDVATTTERAFVGLRFRAVSDQVWEEIYFRPHKAGLPDAIQYAPAFAAAVSNWQLYHGPNDSAAATFAPNAWTHVKVVVQGRTSALYLGNGRAPALVSSLAHEPRDGYIGFWCLDARDSKNAEVAAAVSNVVVTPGTRAVDLPSPAPPPAPPAGVIDRWEVSSAFAAPATGPVTTLPPEVREGRWRSAAAEASGLVAFDRFVTRPSGVRRVAVAARVTVRAEPLRTVAFAFGYSDDASVFLNGTLLYSGVNGYSYNFPRRDGLITIDERTLYLPLAAGDNELVVVVSESFGGWGLMGRIADQSGVRLVASPRH